MPQTKSTEEQQLQLVYLDRLPAGSEALVETIGDARLPGRSTFPRGGGRRAHGRHGREAAVGLGGAEAARGDVGPFFASAVEERLAALGFVPGARLAVQANFGRGPVIVSIRGARVAVGRGQAHKILVRPALEALSGRGQDSPPVVGE